MPHDTAKEGRMSIINTIKSKFSGSRDRDMTQGNIFNHILAFAIPLLLGNLFQMLYNMVDTWVVGKFVSDEAFSAVGTLNSVTNLMISFFLGLAGGAGVVISQYFGAGNKDRVRSAVHTSIAMTLILAVAFTIIGIVSVPLMLNILDMPQEVEREARTYLLIWFSGISGLMFYNIGSGIMRAVGDSTRPFIYLIISALTNTVLDLVFVLALNMGTAGVAVATIISQFLSAILVMISLARTDSAVKLSVKEIKIDFPLLKKIVKIGIPTALQMSITSFSNIFVQSYVNFFGKESMGGWTAYIKIDQVVMLPMQSLGLASTTIVGQNLGKGYIERAQKSANTAFFMCLASTATLIIPVVIFAPYLVAFFNDNPEIIEYGAMYIRLLTPFYVLWTVNQIYSGALRGAGRTTSTMIIMLSSFVAFRQIYLFVISRVINTPVAIAFGYPIGWLIASAATFIYYKKVGLTPKAKKKIVLD